MFKIICFFFIPDVTSTHISQCFNAKKDTVQIVDVDNPFLNPLVEKTAQR